MNAAGSVPSGADRLILPPAIRQEILVHLLRCAPNEGVGMLGVSAPVNAQSGVEVHGEMFIPGTNLDASPTHFTMDPLDVIRAFRTFEERGLQLGAIVHSHLRGPATPSESDVNEWNYPEALMLIISFAQQPPDMAAWRIVEDGQLLRVQPVGLEIRAASHESSGEA